MNSEQHTDPEHHTSGARGLVVGPRIVPPVTRVRIPSRTPHEFTEPCGMIVTGPQHYASVAQLAERWSEVPGVGGANPSRGTKLKT